MDGCLQAGCLLEYRSSHQVYCRRRGGMLTLSQCLKYFDWDGSLKKFEKEYKAAVFHLQVVQAVRPIIEVK